MAEVSDLAGSAVSAASQPTRAFGPVESADETRQAQQSVSNDAPTDVNMNAVVAREQAGTFVLMGKNFEANADRRNKIFDHWLPPKPA
jgi:hypothetical protein